MQEVLEFYKQRGHKLGLISNTVFPEKYHYEDMQHFGIYDYFDEIIFSSEFSHRKPHPSIFEHVLTKLDISANQAFFVGDRMDIDIVGAKNAGLFAVLKKKPGRECDHDGEADLVIDDLRELIENY
jgi:putative hydrolase of the HAD superfamily